MTEPKLAPELASCPFCGGIANSYAHGTEYDPARYWTAMCQQCGAEVGGTNCHAEAEAIAAWNRRVSAQPAKPDTPILIDLDHDFMDTLRSAAGQSNWIPAEYMANDWVSDCASFLRTGEGITAARPLILAEVENLHEALNIMHTAFAGYADTQAKREAIAIAAAAIEAGKMEMKP